LPKGGAVAFGLERFPQILCPDACIGAEYVRC